MSIVANFHVSKRKKGAAIYNSNPYASQASRNGLKINQQIIARLVQLIDTDGTNRGVIPYDRALSIAQDSGLDLVEIVPGKDPPVCKILDYGKYRFQKQKRASEARKKQKTIDIKEIKIRPNIDKHDYDVKIRAANRFLSSGDKVKITVRFRGREMAHTDRGIELLKRIAEDLAEVATTEFQPQLEGRQMTMLIASR